MLRKALMFLIAILSLNIVSAVIINSVDTSTLSPGEEGTIRIEVENILSDTATDISLRLEFKDTSFIPIGTSEQSVDELEEDDEESFVFRIKSSSDIKAGDYDLPYVLTYDIDGQTKTRSGEIGIRVIANPELVYTIETATPVLDQQGKLTLRIVNKGFYDARFVSVKFIPEGFTLLSESQVYIGTVSSDDFETANFDVLFDEQNPDFTAIVEYIDFNNKKVVKTVNLPVTVYTRERATQLGIIKPNTFYIYILLAVALVVIWLVWRIIRKRRRLKTAQQSS
jgi:hypothetical protein